MISLGVVLGLTTVQRVPVFVGTTNKFQVRGRSAQQKAERITKPVADEARERRKTYRAKVTTKRRAVVDKIGSIKVAAVSKPTLVPAAVRLRIRLTRTDGKALGNFSNLTYQLFTIDPDGEPSPLGTKKPARIDASGTMLLDPIKSQKAFVEFAVGDDDEAMSTWEFKNPEDRIYEIPANLTTPKAKPVIAERRVPLVLERARVDFRLQGAPSNLSVRFGSELVPVEPSADGVVFSLPKEVLGNNKQSETDIIVETDGATTRRGVVSLKLTGLDPYQTNLVQFEASSLKLAKAPKIEGGLLANLNLAERANILPNDQVFSFNALMSRTTFVRALPDPSVGQPENGVLKLRYRGLEAAVRPVQVSGGGSAEFVEQIVLTGPEGGQMGGVAVGDSTSKLVANYGPAETNDGESWGYFNRGLEFKVDGGVISSISINRPWPILERGFEFSRGIPYRTLRVENIPGREPSQYAAGAFQIPILNRKDGDTALAECVGMVVNKMKTIGGLTQVETTFDADLLLRWRWENFGYSAGRNESSARLSLKVELLALIGEDGQRLAEPVTIFAEEISGAESSNTFSPTENQEAIAVRRARESLIRKLVTLLRDNVTYTARVTDVRTSSGQITLDVGKEDGVKAGDEFTIAVFDSPVFGAITHKGTQRNAREANVLIVARAVKVLDQSTVCVLEGITSKGQVDQGSFETDYNGFSESDRSKLASQILSPMTGIVTARYRMRNVAAVEKKKS